jgi:hypothetical protein
MATNGVDVGDTVVGSGVANDSAIGQSSAQCGQSEVACLQATFC